MSKISDLTDDERDNFENELGSKSKALGLDQWEAKHSLKNEPWLKQHVGICFDCKRLSWARKEFGGVIAHCRCFDCKLSGKERITDCSSHERVGTLTLNEMMEIATLIEISRKEAGFLTK